ncbi:hypothetical protein AHAS_Ahas19G0238200 [Arachis hypogaea]
MANANPRAKVASNMAPDLEVAISTMSKHLGKTRDWIVALKALMLVYRLMNEGLLMFQNEILYATRRGTMLFNMSDFRDEAHSSLWDHSAFVRTYAFVGEIFDYPEIKRIASKLLETLKEFVKDKAKRPKSPERKEELPLITCEKGGTGAGYE